MKITLDLWPEFENWLLYIKRRRLSRKVAARCAAKSHFKAVASFFATRELNEENIGSFIALCEERSLAPSTINKNLQVINNIIKWKKLPLDIVELFTVDNDINRPVLLHSEILQIANIEINYKKGKEFLNKRNKAIILLRSMTGCRSSEVCELKIEDVVRNPINERHPYYVIFRNTKNKKCHEAKITREVYELIHSLPRQTNLAFETYRGSAMTSHDLWNDLVKRAQECGIYDKKKIQPHDIRRYFATDLDNRGASLPTIQKLMNHADVKTTMRYIKKDFNELSDTVEQLPAFDSERPRRKTQDIAIAAVQKVVNTDMNDLRFTYKGKKLIIEIDERIIF